MTRILTDARLLAAALSPEYGSLMAYVVIGAIAGAVRAAQRPSPRAAPRDVCIQAAGGALSATLAGAACLQYLGADKFMLSLVITGCVGWIGTTAIDRAASILEAFAERRIQQQPPTPPRDPPPPAEGPKL